MVIFATCYIFICWAFRKMRCFYVSLFLWTMLQVFHIKTEMLTLSAIGLSSLFFILDRKCVK
uniref:Uncharacterized protein n=1 Tax=Arundo donax TaxID=35708 RepID=A0A0A9F2A8_ARUDO